MIPKPLLYLLGAAALIGTAIYGEILVRPVKKSDRIVVTYWEKWTGFEGDAMRAVVDAFNESQDKYFVDLLTISNIQNKTLLATAGGIPPDVAGLFGPNATQYAMSGALLPLDEFMKRDGVERDDYIHAYFDMCVVDGQTVCLPSTPASTAFFWNKAHWREAGLDPDQAPRTLSELDAMNDQISRVTPDKKILRAGFLPREPGWWRDRFGYIFGARMWDEETGKVTADSPENIAAYEWTQKYSNKFGASAVSDFSGGFGNFSSPQNPFFDGKVSSVLQGVWMYNFITQYAPGLEWGVAPFPYPDGRPELANMTYIDEDILVIPKGAREPEGAWEFVRFVQSQKGMELLCLGQKKHSPLAVVSDEFWREHENPSIRLFYELAKSPSAQAPPKLGIWPEYSAEMNNAFDRIQRGADVRTALRDVVKRMQPKLDDELALRRARQEERR